MIEKEENKQDLDTVISHMQILKDWLGDSLTQKSFKESIDIAIKCVKKQIPKKPYYEGDGYADGNLVYDYATCPICSHAFEYGINDWESDYCSECGQRLDWGNEDA